MAYVVNVNDPTTPTNSQGAKQGAEELRAIKLKLQAIVAGAVITTAAGANPADIQTFIQPSIEDRPAITAGGWLPWNLNQQWGGAPMPFHMVDSATGVEYKFDAFDQYIDADQINASFGSGAGSFYRYNVLTAPKNLSLQAVWVRLYKTLNPVDNVTLQLYSVAAGVPNALIATANVINGKQITSDTTGQWYRFSFAAVQALVAGTQYMWVISKSGGVDAANFYNLVYKGVSKYPNQLHGIGTAAFAWTPANPNGMNFICEAQASDQVIQSAGAFTGRIIGSEGNPINRSVGYCKPLKEFFPLFHPNGWSILIRGKAWTKDRPIFSAIYGLHHDRIDIRSAAGTGFTTATLYKSDATITTLVGTTDISAATYKDILIVGRSLNDAGDYLRIYTGINNVWTKEAELTGQSFPFDPLFLKQGTGWIMGGFRLFANTDYTKLSDMAILPSADGWTFNTTTGTVEGNVFAVSGGKLSQIKAGMAAGGDGYYLKNAAAFVNANGWAIARKARTISSTNTASVSADRIELQDGTKRYVMDIQEYFIDSNVSTGAVYAQPTDLKVVDSTILVSGKGSDTFVFVNGKLSHDDTGRLTTAIGGNLIQFGDQVTSANENADVIYDYFGYYNTANVYPQFTSGELHEFAVFSGDKNVLAQALYNVGVPISTKSYCGISKNYVNEAVVQKADYGGITNAPATASASDVPVPEAEAFVLGSEVLVRWQGAISNNTAGLNAQTFPYIDGVQQGRTSGLLSEPGGSAGSSVTVSPQGRKVTNYGLHKLDVRYNAVSGGTTSLDGQRRTMYTEARA